KFSRPSFEAPRSPYAETMVRTSGLPCVKECYDATNADIISAFVRESDSSSTALSPFLHSLRQLFANAAIAVSRVAASPCVKLLGRDPSPNVVHRGAPAADTRIVGIREV